METGTGLAKDVAAGVGGFAENLSKGQVRNAFDSLARGLNRGILQAPSRLAHGVFDRIDHLSNAAKPLLGPLGNAVANFTHRVTDAGRTAVDIGVGMVRDFVSTPYEAARDFITYHIEAARHLARGEFGKAAKRFGASLVNAGTRILGGTVDVGAGLLAAKASAIGTLLGIETPGRQLSNQERELFGTIYGSALDLDRVRVKRGGPVSWGAAKTVGDTIYLENKHFGPAGNLNREGRRTLLHEMGHVWQNQNGGGDYKHKSLWSQLRAHLATGDRNEAYEWVAPMRSGVPFEHLNPEAQASLIEFASQHRGSLTRGMRLTDADVAYIEDAMERLRRPRADARPAGAALRR